MGVLRDLFDMFMQIRKIKDDKRKDYFNNVVLKTYDQLRTVHENFLTVFAECIEMSEATGDVQEVIKHLRTSRPRMQTIRQEIYEKTRAYWEDHKEARDFLVLKFDQEENEEVMDFLLSCLEYFQIRNHYSHDLGNMLNRLESVSVDLVSSESYDARMKATS